MIGSELFEHVEPGNMVIVQGDDETKAWLRGEPERIDDWLYELVDGIVFYAAGRLKEHAPGGIKELVGVDLADRTLTGAFEGTAGVEPDFDVENDFGRGLGSDPADYPVYVDVGTGIFGDVGRPISSIPGHLMGPIFDSRTGRTVYAKTIKGQRPQRYSNRSFDDTVAYTEVLIRSELVKLGRRL